jgi:putative hydrolase of the HAD superfamily
MRALLDDLRPRVWLAIISNATDTLESGLEGWGLTPYFEVIINSYRVGCAKPDPRIYCLALDRLQVRPDQAVFTDDQQHNVDAAAELGIRAIRFTGVPDLTAFLEDLGLTGD